MRLMSRILLMLALAPVAAAAQLDAHLERERIAAEETVTLVLIASGDLEGEPELAPLNRDFDVVDRSHTSRLRFRDGRSMRSQEWRLELAPRRTGRLTVPPLQLGGVASAPLTLEVSDAPGAVDGDEDKGPVFVEVSAKPRNPYVKSQVAYRVRLFTRSQLQDWELTDPQTDAGIVRRLGADRELSESIGGQAYRVIERQYAIFPLRTGLIEVAAPQLTAAIPDTRAQAGEDGFGEDPFAPIEGGADAADGAGEPSGITRQLRTRGEALTLEVRLPPVGSKEPWLPAESVGLADGWEPSTEAVSAGQPLLRTLTLTAVGTLSAQLPEFELANPPGIELEAGPSQTRDLLDGRRPVAVKELTVSYVPIEPGLVRLPEIRLSWWDTGSDQPRTAVIGPRTLRVGLAATTDLGRAPPAEETPGGKAQPSGTGARLAERLRGWLRQDDLWPPLAAALGLGWAMTTLLWWRERRRSATHRRSRRQQGRRAQERATARARRAVKAACGEDNARGARDALLAWGALSWPAAPPRGLLAMAARVESPEAAAALTRLDRTLYGEEPPPWDGRAAWTALQSALHSARRA